MENILPEVKTVEENDESEYHWHPQGHGEHATPGEVQRNLLAEVVSYFPQRLKATRLGPGTIQLVTGVHHADGRRGRRSAPALGGEVPDRRFIVVLVESGPDHLEDFSLAGIVHSGLVVHWKRAVAVAVVKHVQQTCIIL